MPLGRRRDSRHRHRVAEEVRLARDTPMNSNCLLDGSFDRRADGILLTSSRNLVHREVYLHSGQDSLFVTITESWTLADLDRMDFVRSRKAWEVLLHLEVLP